ncbi:MAG TPA: ABC transporter permease subunit [Fimbriiglobus sp.]|jgi:ABC-type transport system involved in multi-copper enzyme maturation permease subunit|nr:ABC transporter permease subunit [Fimbriiglobus sp.]
MFSWLTNTNILIGGLILAVVQVLAALPWLRSIDTRGFDRSVRNPATLMYAIAAVLGIGLLFAAFIGYKGDSSNLRLYGRMYGAALHLQLLIDLFLLAPALLAWALPKTGAVAMAAYREGWRQPMFWLVIVFGVLLTWVAVVLPYFTFGDDYKMMKQIGFDVVMLAAVLFGVLAASISISEEIEGRSAITVMSKPVSRRQFLLGKFLGILMACGGMSMILALNLNAALLVMPEFDKINEDRAFDPMPMQAKESFVPAFQKAVVVEGPARTLAEGAGMWFGEVFAHTFGIALGFGQVMILVAIATALATRLPFVVNLVICLVVYFLGHLAPVVVRVTDEVQRRAAGQENVALGLVQFFGNLFDTLLPALEFFNMGPAIIRETPLDLWQFAAYVGTVVGYALLYTVIALVVGLLLFEDRDLA